MPERLNECPHGIKTYELYGAGIFVSVTNLFPRAQEAHFIFGFSVDYFFVFPTLNTISCLCFRRPKPSNGSSLAGPGGSTVPPSSGCPGNFTAAAMANAAAAQAMIPMGSTGSGGGAGGVRASSPPLRTYTGSLHAHRHHNSNTRSDHFLKSLLLAFHNQG